MSIQIFAMTHKAFTPPRDSLYVPLQVGRANAEDLGYLGDHTGDHISNRNCYYAELSGIYWVYKNYHKSDYVGICHYRRYLINEEEKLFTAKELEDILSKVDVITTKTLELRSNYYDGFKENHNIKDLLVVEKIFRQKYPKDYAVYEKLVHGNKTYFGNICVMKKSLFDKYCEWLFDIFFEAEKHLELSSYDRYQMRFFGFVSEFLLYVFIKARNLTTYECKVGMIGEKAETRECKEKLADFFIHRDIDGAKAYFLKCQKERPDILMEASDVTGELRQCMQVIATAGLEKQLYGSTLLDSINAYPKLMQYIAKINRTVNRYLLENNSYDDDCFIRENEVSEIAWRVAVKLFCKDEVRQEEIVQQIMSKR